MRFTSTPVFLLPEVWPQVCPGIDRVLKQGLVKWSTNEVYQKLASGEWLLFTMWEDETPVVSLIAQVRGGPEEMLFDVGMCWGSRVDEWIEEVYQAFEVLARQCHCGRIAFNGRPGWRKLARKLGFEVNTVTYSKVII